MTCAGCAKEFEADIFGGRFCSQRCRRRDYYEAHRDELAEYGRQWRAARLEATKPEREARSAEAKARRAMREARRQSERADRQSDRAKRRYERAKREADRARRQYRAAELRRKQAAVRVGELEEANR